MAAMDLLTALVLLTYPLSTSTEPWYTMKTDVARPGVRWEDPAQAR